MKHKLVFLSIILFTATINGMKRKKTESTPSRQKHKKQCTNAYLRSPKTILTHKKQPVTGFISLSKDILHFIIIDLIINDPTTINQSIAMKTIHSLDRTNKHFNTLINESTFSDNLIKNFAKNYYCSHELIANCLHTKTATQRLNLQIELKELCCGKKKLQQNLKLDDLINRGVNLDFIFKYHKYDRTILMMAVKKKRDAPFFGYLIEKGINLNACNLLGFTALHAAVEYPIIEDTLDQLINCQHLIINQQNDRGETPLLWSIINRKKFLINNLFLNTIKKLLLHGADPELGNNDNLTPLAAAKDLNNNQKVIDIIKKAIAKKHAAKN